MSNLFFTLPEMKQSAKSSLEETNKHSQVPF